MCAAKKKESKGADLQNKVITQMMDRVSAELLAAIAFAKVHIFLEKCVIVIPTGYDMRDVTHV